MPISQDKPIVLVVDDSPQNLDILTSILAPHFRIKVALNGEKALKIAEATSGVPDIILLDVVMPGLDGYEVCKRLKARSETRRIPVIFVTSMNEREDERHGLELGAVDYLTKPVNAAIVLARVRTHLALYDQTRELERLVLLRTAELERTRRQIISRLGRAAEFRDNETGNHVLRMSHYSRLIATAAGLSDDAVDLLFNAAPMHDVGKIGIPDAVLLKPGKLDSAEWEIMRTHPAMGAEIIGEQGGDLLRAAGLVALTHHEKWDGSGYPNGLKGDAIPMFGRIVAIADVFDALTSVRPYKKAWAVEDAVAHIEQCAGSHFDPSLIPAFRSVLSDIVFIKGQYAEEHGALNDLDYAK